jgi:hypothetical protein
MPDASPCAETRVGILFMSWHHRPFVGDRRNALWTVGDYAAVVGRLPAGQNI